MKKMNLSAFLVLVLSATPSLSLRYRRGIENDYGNGETHGDDSSDSTGSGVGQHLDIGGGLTGLSHGPAVHSIEVEKHVQVPIYNQVSYPFPQPVPHPVAVPVPIRVPFPIAIKVPVPVSVEKKVEVPVEKHVPYTVEKPYPVEVIQRIPYPVPKPYPVHIPIHKVKHIYSHSYHH